MFTSNDLPFLTSSHLLNPYNPVCFPALLLKLFSLKSALTCFLPNPSPLSSHFISLALFTVSYFHPSLIDIHSLIDIYWGSVTLHCPFQSFPFSDSSPASKCAWCSTCPSIRDIVSSHGSIAVLLSLFLPGFQCGSTTHKHFHIHLCMQSI